MSVNPIVPATYDLFWVAVLIAYIVALVIALAIVWRERRTLDGFKTAIWAVVAVILPVVFIAGWGSARMIRKSRA